MEVHQPCSCCGYVRFAPWLEGFLAVGGCKLYGPVGERHMVGRSFAAAANEGPMDGSELGPWGNTEELMEKESSTDPSVGHRKRVKWR